MDETERKKRLASLNLPDILRINKEPYYSALRIAIDHAEKLRAHGISVAEDRINEEYKTILAWGKHSSKLRVKGMIMDIEGWILFSPKVHDTLCNVVRMGQAERYLGVSHRVLYNFIMRGELKTEKLPGLGKQRETQYVPLQNLLDFKEKLAASGRVYVNPHVCKAEEKILEAKKTETVKHETLEQKADIVSEKVVELSIGNASDILKVEGNSVKILPIPDTQKLEDTKKEDNRTEEEYLSPRERIKKMSLSEHLWGLSQATRNIDHVEKLHIEYFRDLVDSFLRDGQNKQNYNQGSTEPRHVFTQALKTMNRGSLPHISEKMTVYLARLGDSHTKKELQLFFESLKYHIPHDNL